MQIKREVLSSLLAFSKQKKQPQIYIYGKIEQFKEVGINNQELNLPTFLNRIANYTQQSYSFFLYPQTIFNKNFIKSKIFFIFVTQ